MLTLPSIQGLVRFFAVIVLLLLIGAAISLFLATHFVTGTINYVVGNLANRSGLSPFLVRGLTIVLTIPFFWAVAKYSRNIIGLFNLGWNPVSFYSNWYGLVIVMYIGSFFLTMYWASLDAYAYKYCAETPEGIVVSDGPGKDPVYGEESKACTISQIKQLRSGQGKLKAPTEIQITDAGGYSWFDPLTSKPRVWYAIEQNGEYRFFDGPGADSHSGQPLQPVTAEVIQHMVQQREQANAARARAVTEAANLIKQKAQQDALESSKEKELLETQDLMNQAQRLFDSRHYGEAIQDCDKVLARLRNEDNCRTIRQHASIKLSEELVNKGIRDFEHGDFDEALWDAEKAIKLDPTNRKAANLRELATKMRLPGVAN